MEKKFEDALKQGGKNEEIIILLDKLIAFLKEKNLLGTAEAQSVYHVHILGSLIEFSGRISGYKQLIERFGVDLEEFYPELNTHINCLAIDSFSFKELPEDCQEISRKLVENMYEWIQVIKTAFPEELIQMIGERKAGKNNYYISQSFFDIDDNTFFTLYNRAARKLPECMSILNFPEKRRERLLLAEEFEKKLYEAESNRLKKLGVL